jgi:hypothetical protein
MSSSSEAWPAIADGSRYSLERALIRVLRAFFPKLKADDLKTDFFAVYKKEADEFDREFTKKYDEDLNTTLIFVIAFAPLLPHCHETNPQL